MQVVKNKTAVSLSTVRLDRVEKCVRLENPGGLPYKKKGVLVGKFEKDP